MFFVSAKFRFKKISVSSIIVFYSHIQYLLCTSAKISQSSRYCAPDRRLRMRAAARRQCRSAEATWIRLKK